MTYLRRLGALCLLAALGSCAGHRMAGSMQVTTSGPVILKIDSVDPASLDIQIWNRGPQDVHFEQVLPAASERPRGVMKAKGREYAWQADTLHFELVMTVAEGEASVGYVVRSDRGVSLVMGQK